MARMDPSKLCTFIGEGRDPDDTLRRLQNDGLIREEVDEKQVFSVIVDAFIREARADLEYLERLKKLGPEPLDPSSQDRLDRAVMPGETRAHLCLDVMLKEYLSAEGLQLQKTSEW